MVPESHQMIHPFMWPTVKSQQGPHKADLVRFSCGRVTWPIFWVQQKTNKFHLNYVWSHEQIHSHTSAPMLLGHYVHRHVAIFIQKFSKEFHLHGFQRAIKLSKILGKQYLPTFYFAERDHYNQTQTKQYSTTIIFSWKDIWTKDKRYNWINLSFWKNSGKLQKFIFISLSMKTLPCTKGVLKVSPWKPVFVVLVIHKVFPGLQMEKATENRKIVDGKEVTGYAQLEARYQLS